ncbi:MAG: glycosyltransferase [Pseudomonadota bacterium]
MAILRNSGLSRDEFFKYRADGANLVFAVGAELEHSAQSWGGAAKVRSYGESLLASEFFAPKPKPTAFPSRILVAGSEQPSKGWADFFVALTQVEQAHTSFPVLQLALTGTESEGLLKNYRGRAQFRFLGRVNHFAACAREYDLAIHPSRNESFGLAPFEILAAGVPVLCSSTGEMSARILPPELLFPPNDVEALAQRLQNLYRNWSQLDFHLPDIQQRLRERYSARIFAQQFLATLRSVVS